VLDGGAGIAPTERDAIFERFQRGGNTTAPGFGLGLAIGAELARRMRGELQLEQGDPAPGEPAGARFVLILPHA
jgi:signal transduction histidine kinase